MNDLFTNGNVCRNWADDAKKIFEVSRERLSAILVTETSIRKDGEEFVIRISNLEEEIRVKAVEYKGLPLSWNWAVDLEGTVYAVASWSGDLWLDSFKPEAQASLDVLLPTPTEVGRLPQGLATRLPGEFGRNDVPVYRDEAREYRQRLLAALQEDTSLNALPAGK